MADVGMMKDGMARPTGRDMFGWFMRGEVALALGVVLIICLLIIPMSSFILDLLLAISITGSVLVLMTALLIKRPLDFAVFPTVLLVVTLYRWPSTRTCRRAGSTRPRPSCAARS